MHPVMDLYFWRHCGAHSTLYATAFSKGNDDYSPLEIENMEALILSLSGDQNDQSRRERVAEIFTEELAKPNGYPQRFSNLFGKVLIDVGDRVRGEAMQKALQKQQSTEPNEQQQLNDDDAHLSSTGVRQKTTEELQVWALIDMMVQSKTIIKKANGQLGSEGAFG